MEEQKEETITLKKTTIWKISAVVLGILFIISIFTGGFGFRDNAPTGGTVLDDTGNNEPTIIAKVSVDDDPVLGNKNAPVTIIEFSDYQCPFCRRSYTQVYSLLKENFINTDKAKLVFRDFPLTSIHPGALPAAEAAECGDEQGKYWEMHDKIFDEQNKFGQGTVPFTNDDLKKWASEIGLSTGDFNSCLDSGKYKSEVEKDFSDGNAYGVSGTPTYFIGNDKDGYVIVGGAQPYQVFEQAINQYL